MDPIIFQIGAMLLSPLVALRVSTWLSDRKDVRKRKLAVFHTLMMTREAWLSSEHVRALNAIDIEFYGDKRAKKILEAWRAYLNHLNQPLLESDAEKALWSKTRTDLFVALLYEMARYFNYDFDATFLRSTSYTPRLHGLLDDQMLEARTLLVEVLRGERALPIFPLPVAAAPTLSDTDALKRELDEPKK